MNTELLKNRAIELDLACRELADDHDISYGQALALLQLAHHQITDGNQYELTAGVADYLQRIETQLINMDVTLSVIGHGD